MPARSPYDPALEAAGRSAAELVLPGSTWVHRRVQSLRYLEPDLLEVRLSIDFTVPATPRLSHLPLTMLPKWPPLFRFDYRDITGTPVPLLTTNENGSTDRGVLFSLTDRVKPALLEDGEYVDAVLTLAEGPETHLESAYETVRNKLLTTVTPERDRLIDIAAALVDSTLLWYPVEDAERGRRRIAKLRYRIPNLDALDWERKVARSLAWYRQPEQVPLLHLGADANFHLEIEAPPVLRIVEPVRPRFWWLTPADPAAEDTAASSDAPADTTPLPAQHAETSGRYAHIYVSGRRPMSADVTFRFAPGRGGFVMAAFVAGLLIALFATVFYANRGVLHGDTRLDGSVALLLLVPALISYVAVRPTDPPLVRRYLLGLQLLVVIAAAIPVVMAVILMIDASTPNALGTAWCPCVAEAWFIVGMLALSLWRSGS